VAGGLASDSERDISVGGVSVVPTSCFDGVDYTALGHLHGAQRLSETVRYSGSPIAYSFSEEHQRKAVLLVDLPPRPGAPLTVEALPTPVQRPIARMRSTLDDLLTADRWARFGDHFLQVTLTDAERPRDAMARLRRRFPQTLVLAFEPDSSAADAPSYAALLRGRTDLEVATDFVAHVRSAPDSDEAELLARALESVRADEVAV
jgi:exonuclease SbcD